MAAAAARSRVPLALAVFSVVGGGLWWQTAGGHQQPKSRAQGDPSRMADVSGTLQELAGTGGSAARRRHGSAEMDHDTKDTRIFSATPDVHSKRNPDKQHSGTKSQAAVLDAAQQPTAGSMSGRDRAPADDGKANDAKHRSGHDGAAARTEGGSREHESSGRAWATIAQSPKDGGAQSLKEDKPISQKERSQRAAFSPAGSGVKTTAPKEADPSSLPQGKGFAEPNRA